MRLCLTFALLAGSALAADWPAYRGPSRTGASSETGLLKTWPATGPNLAWKTDKAGQGYAGMAVVSGVVYTMGARGDDEYAIAFDARGNELWAIKLGPVHDWNGNSWSRGPDATPTVDGDYVYALSSKGDLLCAEKASGKPVWRSNLPKDMTAQVNPVGGGIEDFGWGYTWSPLVDGDNLILTPGGPKGLFAAVEKKTGKPIWRSSAVTDQATYSSAVAATIGGVRQYIYIVQNGVVGVSAKDGSLLWRHKRDDDYPDVTCPSPLVQGELVYVSVGYGGGAELLRLTGNTKGFKAEVVYSEKRIGNRQGGVVPVGKHVYGYDDDKAWACQEFDTGTIAWPKGRAKQAVKAGSVLAADGRLYVVEEADAPNAPGGVCMLEASPSAFKVISQFKLPLASKNRKPRGNVWTHPSLSDGKLYVRDQELLFCYDVK